MYRLNLPYNQFEGYCKYKNAAYEQFFDAVDRIKPKSRAYKNGNRSYWFKNKDLASIKPILESMSFESIAFEVKKLK